MARNSISKDLLDIQEIHLIHFVFKGVLILLKGNKQEEQIWIKYHLE